jgi:hypothetical protein
MTEYKSLDNDTRKQPTSAGYTGITRLCISASKPYYDRSTANKMLDSVKDGQYLPPNILTLALIATGDLP